MRESTPLTHHDPEQLKRLDALDLNGRDLLTQGRHPYIEKLEEFADELELPIVGGSDTHQYIQYGVIMNETDQDCETVDDLKAMINESNFEIKITDDLDVKVKSARIIKKLIKSSLDSEGYATIYDEISAENNPATVFH